MKKENELERIVYLINKALSNELEISILKNHILYNSSGSAREFDVILTTQINQIPVTIAIECKSNNRKIQVDKIEAFNSKCDRIPSINKKVFVSSKGFQKDAILAAKHFDIELLTLEEINNNKIWSWLLKGFKLFIPTIVYDVKDFEVFYKSGNKKYKSKIQNFNFNLDDFGELNSDRFIDFIQSCNKKEFGDFILERYHEFGSKLFSKSFGIRQRVTFTGLVQVNIDNLESKKDLYLSEIYIYYHLFFKESTEFTFKNYNYKDNSKELAHVVTTNLNNLKVTLINVQETTDLFLDYETNNNFEKGETEIKVFQDSTGISVFW